MDNELIGCLNKSLDKVLRIDTTWSDTNPKEDYSRLEHVGRLNCRFCGSNLFEILSLPGEYETIAKCGECGIYYIVHSG